MTELDVAIFDHLGWELEDEGSQKLCVCPFCGKHKMYVDPKKTTYHCKVCNASGNALSAIGEMFSNVYRKNVPLGKLKALAKRKDLPLDAFRLDKNIGYDPASSRFVFYCAKPDGKPVTLRRVIVKKSCTEIRNMKGTKIHLVGCEALEEHKQAPVYICEGEWDRIAWMYVLEQVGVPGVVLATPGAGNFSKEWAEYLKGRKVFLLYDNDDPGTAGMVRAHKFLKPRARSVRYLHWSEEMPDGFDIRDAVVNSEDMTEVYNGVVEACELYPPGSDKSNASEDPDKEVEEQESLDPISVEELHAVFNKWLLLENCDLLDVVMGSLWSMFFGGNPLWLLVVSPPSGSKSETLIPVSEWHRCFALSNLTSKSLISGFQTAGGGDPSLFAELDGTRGALIVKDLTPLLQAREVEREEVFGILRDAYDGSAKKVFGNGVTRSYTDLHFTFIAGVTPAIDAHDSVAMGERFLKFRADREIDRSDDLQRAIRAIANTGKEEGMKDELRLACLQSLARKLDPSETPDPDEKFVQVVSSLSVLCAKMRAVAPADKFNDVQTMSPLSEAPPRLASQFTKLAKGLSMHFEAEKLSDARILNLLKRVSIHTPDIITVRIVRALYDAYEQGGVTPKALAPSCAGLSSETVRQVLVKLARTGLCETIRPALEERTLLYRLEESSFNIIENYGLFKNLPKNDPLYRKKRLTLKGSSKKPARRSKAKKRRAVL